MNDTPDSLRGYADTADEDSRPDIAGVLRSHADSWDRDIEARDEALQEAYVHTDKLEADNAALRERVEQAEAWIRMGWDRWAEGSQPEVTP